MSLAIAGVLRCPSSIRKAAARIFFRPAPCLYDAIKGNVFKYGNFSHDRFPSSPVRLFKVNSTFKCNKGIKFSLQGSEMFIVGPSNSITRAPAERNVSVVGTVPKLWFRSAGARKTFLEVALSINISPLMGRRATMFCCTFRVGASGAASRRLVHPMVTTVHIPKSRRPDYSVAPFGSG